MRKFPNSSEIGNLNFIFNYTGIIYTESDCYGLHDFIEDNMRDALRESISEPHEEFVRFYKYPTESQVRYIRLLEQQYGREFEGTTRQEALKYLKSFNHPYERLTDLREVMVSSISLDDMECRRRNVISRQQYLMLQDYEDLFTGSTYLEALEFIKRLYGERKVTYSQYKLLQDIERRLGDKFEGTRYYEAHEFIKSKYEYLKDESRERSRQQNASEMRTKVGIIGQGRSISKSIFDMISRNELNN